MKDSEKQRIFSDGYAKLIHMLTSGNLNRDNIEIYRNYARRVETYCTKAHHRLMVDDAINFAIRQVSQGDTSLIGGWG